MNVKSIRLHPFAGIQDQTFSFGSGLNIVQGPNEAGKSTLFKALLHGLFTATNKPEKQLKKDMGDFFPVGGGDVIRLELQFNRQDGGEVKVKKVWKHGNRQGSANLHFSDGTEITNEDEVQKQLEAMLPVSPATMRTILLSDQSGLQETLKKMKDTQQVRTELGSVLRKSVMETGGVSVDRFRKLLEEKYEAYFKRWDRSQQYPENGRGINNPFKTGLGKVLEAFYKKEQAQKDYQQVKEFEEQLDEINQKIAGLSEQYQEKKAEFDKLHPLKEGIRQRQSKEHQLSELERHIERYQQVNREWPVTEERLNTLQSELEKADKQIQAYQEEFHQAERLHQLKSLRDRVARLDELHGKYQQAIQEVKDAQPVTQDDIRDLRQLQTDINRLQAQVDAAKLSVTIEAKTEGRIGWQEAGKQDSEEISLEAEQQESRSASGGFTLETEQLKLKVFSGEGDIEETVQLLEDKRSSFDTKLEKLNAPNLQEAESLAELYHNKVQHKDQLEKQYTEELGEDDYDSLRNQLKEAGAGGEPRAMSQITDDLTTAKNNKSQLEQEKQDKEIQLGEWKEEFGSHDKVAEKLGDIRVKYRELSKELEKLPTLPEGYESAEEFIRYTEQLDQELRELKDEIGQLKQDRAGLEGQAPGASSEELSEQAEEAEAEFERINQEAETLARVREKSLQLLDSLDEQTYSGLEQSFLSWLKEMSGGRFKTVRMNQDMPEQFVTQEDRELPFQLLSHGTKGTVALAWRFALCEHFLAGQNGVVVLDDPLVDMDPKRRKAAIAGIEKFAEQYQVLVLTCHPEHVGEVSDGKVVELN